MQEVSALVVNNVVTMLAVIIATYAAMFVVEKIINFAIDSFNGIKTPDGWLKSIKTFESGIRKKVG